MLNHILIPLDFSPLAEKALKYALEIVGNDGQITLLSVVEPQLGDAYSSMTPGVVGAMAETSFEDQQTRATDYLNQIAHNLAKPHPRVEISVQLGSPADVIVDTAKSFGVDAIVMSTHGRTGLSRWLFGSVTQKVLGATPCPVFVIPSKAENESDVS